MQRFISGTILLPFSLFALLSAGGAGAATAAKGTLTLTVNGIAGNGNVVAQNNLGVRTLLKEGANALNAGNYIIIAKSLRQKGVIVNGMLIGTVNLPVVKITAGGKVPRIATYAPGVGRLWLPASLSKTLHGYNRVQLVHNTNAAGSATITGAGMAPYGTAVDAAGNVYVADRDANAVLIYTARQATVGGSSAPTATIANATTTPLEAPVGLAFDAGGNLWVTNYIGGSLVKYTANQVGVALALKGSRTLTPPVVIHSAAFNKPYGQAFDTAGNLWIANNRGNTVIMVAKAGLAKSGTVTATHSIDKITGGAPLITPRSPAFDSQGNLWVASAIGNKVVKYTINAMTGAATPASATSLTLADGTTAVRPSGLAFDAQGNLWVSVSGNPNGYLLKYAVAGLTNGATVKPTTTVTGFGATGGVLLSFDPSPANLPFTH